MWEEETSQGWAYSHQWVCTNCVDDQFLERKLRDAEDSDAQCEFCDARPAAPLDVLLESFVAGIYTEYANADDEGIPYVSREGGYQADIKDTWEIVDEFGDALIGPGLLEAMRDSIHDQPWVSRFHWRLSTTEALHYGWDSFCDAIKNETRYVFWLHGNHVEDAGPWSDGIPASKILQEVGSIVDRHGLYRYIEVDEPLWRARTHSEPKVEWGAKHLGTMKREDSRQANRMNPAGIPMFYGATDIDTAIRESLVRTSDTYVTAAAFLATQAVTVVDLTNEKLPTIPSLFDTERVAERQGLFFARFRRKAQPANTYLIRTG